MLTISGEGDKGASRTPGSPPGPHGWAVRVPIPKSLPELQHVAAQNFGHSGCLRLYKDGKTLIYHPKQVAELKDNDTVIVRRTDHQPCALVNVMSTAQADFKRHPFKAPPAPIGSDDESTLSDISRNANFQGMSRYARDFVRHPPEATNREAFQSPSALHFGTEPLGTTSYAKDFPWRDHAKPRGLLGSDEDSCLTNDSKGFRFEAQSSYANDFKGSKQPRPERALPKHALASPRTAKLCAETTYGSDFASKDSGRMPSARPVQEALRNEPFQASSEYRRQYERHGLDRLHYIKMLFSPRPDGVGGTTPVPDSTTPKTETVDAAAASAAAPSAEAWAALKKMEAVQAFQ